MKPSGFKTQYRKFRLLTARFFSYWFFILFATIGTVFAIAERFLHLFRMEGLELTMILILAYAILVYLVTERAKVLDEIHDGIKVSKVKVYPTREAVYMSIPLIIGRAAADEQGRRRIFHAALHGSGGKRIARPSEADAVFDLFDREIDACVASSGTGMWRVYELFNITDEEHLDAVVVVCGTAPEAAGNL